MTTDFVKHTIIRIFGYLLVWVSLPSHIFAQSAGSMHKYGLAEGLSQNMVYCLYQDTDGYIWVGTHDGLNRFDGYQFKNYYNKPNNTSTLADNIINEISQDDIGDIWVATSKYVHRFKKNKEAFERYVFDKSSTATLIKPELNNANHIRIVPLKQALLLVDTLTKEAKSIRYTENNAIIRRQKTGNIISHQKWGTLTLAPKGIGGLYTLEKSLKKLIPAIDKNLDRLHNEKIIYIEANNDFLLAINESFELIILGQEGVMGKYPLPPYFTEKTVSQFLMQLHAFPNHELLVVWPDRAEKYAFATGKGLSLIQTISYEPGITAWSSMIDNRDQLWIGSFGNGLLQYNTPLSGINNRVIDAGYPIYQTRNIAQLMHTRSNKLIVGYYPIDYSIIADVEGNKQNLPIKEIFNNQALSADIFRLSKENMHYLPMLKNMVLKSELVLLNKKYFLKDSGNRIWWCGQQNILSADGVSIFNAGAYIEGVAEDNEHNWWLGTGGNGLICFNPHKKTFTKFMATGDGNSVISNFINEVLYDPRRNIIWIATRHGLSSFHQATNTFKNYTTRDGLCHANIYSMLLDKSGKLWLGTGNGLSRLVPETAKFTTYTTSDGLVNDEYNRNAASIDAAGVLYFGGTNGIDVIDPTLLARHAPPPKTLITSLKATEQEMPLDSVINLQPTQNNIHISFAAIDFRHPGKTLYAYRLSNHQTQWTTTMGVHEVTYAELPPDTYKFEVKSATTPNEWGPVSTISFFIKTPWWQQWWFYTLSGLLVIGALYGFLQYRMRQRWKVIEMRQRIQRDLHDDVGATLSSVKAYADILQEQPGNTMIAGLIQTNAEEMIDRLDLIAWSTNPNHDTLESLLEKIKFFAYPLLAASDVHFLVINKIGHLKMMISGQVRQHLFLITKEAINNVSKHSMAKHCTLTMFIKNRQFSWIITDDGQGAQPNENRGNGLANMAERAKQAGGFMKWYDSPGKGFEIYVTIPYPFKSMI